MIHIFFLSILFINKIEAVNISDLPWLKDVKDGQELEIIGKYLPQNPTIIEAGTCDAEDTCKMKQKWPEAIIHGFEAFPEHFKLSQKNTSQLKDVTLYPYALFDKIGTLTFYASQKVPGASSLLKDNIDNIEIPKDIQHDGVNYRDKAITVQSITIDEWAKQHNIKKIDYIWLDTEGAELYILRCAKTILPTVKAISTEINFKEFRSGMTLFDDLYKFLTEQGFTLTHIWGRNDWQATGVFVRK